MSRVHPAVSLRASAADWPYENTVSLLKIKRDRLIQVPFLILPGILKFVLVILRYDPLCAQMRKDVTRFQFPLKDAPYIAVLAARALLS